MRRKSKKSPRLPLILVPVVLAAGMAMILYPLVSNQIYENEHTIVTTEFEQQVDQVEEQHRQEILAAAQDYNQALLKADIVLTEPFDPSVLEREGSEPYMQLLNYARDGVMGYLEIPVIQVQLPIYHGTTSEILEKGIGHLEQTSLPVGGVGVHSVLTGHSALAGKRLLTDLPELKEGDVFYIHVLKDILAYQVSDINIVEPDDTQLLGIDPAADKVTLVTCYPYGINSHRLLVTGSRVEYTAAQEQEQVMVRETKQIWQEEYKKALLLCLAVYLPILLVGSWIIGRRAGQKKRRH